MQRRIMTEKDKRAYVKKKSGKISVFERLSNVGHKKKLVSGVFIGLLILAAIGFIIYENVRPMRFKDVIGGKYESVSWSNESNLTAEELNTWSIERVFPGSLGDSEQIECCFYDDAGVLVGSVTFLGHDNLFIYEGQVYQYTEPPKK